MQGIESVNNIKITSLSFAVNQRHQRNKYWTPLLREFNSFTSPSRSRCSWCSTTPRANPATPSRPHNCQGRYGPPHLPPPPHPTPATPRIPFQHVIVCVVCTYMLHADVAHALTHGWRERRHKRRMKAGERDSMQREWLVNGKVPPGSAPLVTVRHVEETAPGVNDVLRATSAVVRDGVQNIRQGADTISFRSAPRRTVFRNFPVYSTQAWEGSTARGGSTVTAWVVLVAVVGGLLWFLSRQYWFTNIVQSIIAAGRGKPKGRYIRDRSLGGKMIFIPEGSDADESYDTSLDPEQSRTVAPRPIRASSAMLDADVGECSWWSNVTYARCARGKTNSGAAALLRKLERRKARGRDYELEEVTELVELCLNEQCYVKPQNRGTATFMLRMTAQGALAAARGTAPLYGLDAQTLLMGLAGALQLPRSQVESVMCGEEKELLRTMMLTATSHLRSNEGLMLPLVLEEAGNILNVFPIPRGNASLALRGMVSSEERSTMFVQYLKLRNPPHPLLMAECLEVNVSQLPEGAKERLAEVTGEITGSDTSASSTSTGDASSEQQ